MLDKSIYEKANEIISSHGKKQSSLIPVMKDIQAIYKTIAPELLSYVAKELDISEEDAYSSASKKFSLDLKGRYIIKVCDGIACHAKKGTLLLDFLYKELGLSADKNTTDDLLFTVEPSECLSSCGQAPVMTVNDKLYTQMTEAKVKELISQLRVEFNVILESGVDNLPSDKAIDITGAVNNPGLMDIPAGTSINEIIDKYCGGLTAGSTFKGAKLGAAPGASIIVTDPDYKVDFDALKRNLIRTRKLQILDNNDCMVDIAMNLMKYSVSNDICGKCVPCREGTMRMDEMLQDIVAGRGDLEQLDMIDELGTAITDTALCKLGITSVIPILTTLNEFRDEYTEHIRDKKCRAGKCKALLNYVIVPEICRGCSKCARNCPVGAISGVIKEPYEIDRTKCIKCGACAAGCPFKAISRV